MGEQGYRTAIASHGIGGRDNSLIYFEVEVMNPKTPLPYVNINAAVRVGVCQVDIQDVDKPLGSNKISYGYSSTGKLVNHSKAKTSNQVYGK